jgi:hypothetical protein
MQNSSGFAEAYARATKQHYPSISSIEYFLYAHALPDSRTYRNKNISHPYATI